MFRISRLTDYGTLILVYLAEQDGRLCSASEVAGGTRVAPPTVQKLLKALARTGLVDSVRGVDGGYRLSRSPRHINAAQILDALEGPVAITECSTGDSQCELEAMCHVGSAWQRINSALRLALSDISLEDLGRQSGDLPPLELGKAVAQPRNQA
jgi:FeS assembly SUF system regulator